MRRINWISLLVTAVTFVGSPAIAADISTDVTFDFFSKYIWRGQNLNDDPVFQPAVTFAYGNLSGGVWANMDMTSYTGNSGEFTEYDYWIDYSDDLAEGISYSVGGIYYDLPSGEATQEVYAGLSFDLPLSPSVTLYYDVDEIQGAYTQFSLGHTIEKFQTFSSDCYCDLVFGASLGYGSSSYNEGYFDVGDSGFNDLVLSASLPICFTNGLTVTPSLSYITLVDNDIRAADTYDQKSDYVVAGVSLGLSF